MDWHLTFVMLSCSAIKIWRETIRLICSHLTCSGLSFSAVRIGGTAYFACSHLTFSMLNSSYQMVPQDFPACISCFLCSAAKHSKYELEFYVLRALTHIFYAQLLNQPLLHVQPLLCILFSWRCRLSNWILFEYNNTVSAKIRYIFRHTSHMTIKRSFLSKGLVHSWPNPLCPTGTCWHCVVLPLKTPVLTGLSDRKWTR